jgi:benzoyl-CoA reductase/2-hydroxyglutaryl-CoA dehydratase subunit BcrC/BadD/HgdB
MNQPIGRRIATIIEVCESQRIEGLLDRYHVGCRIVAADAILIEKAVKKELGIPVMLLEWENFDPRVFKLEEYKQRFSAFKTMMLSRAS